MIEITDQMTDREFLAWCRDNYSMPRDVIYRLHELAGNMQWTDWPDYYCYIVELRVDLAEARELARVWEQTAHAVQNELALSREMAKAEIETLKEALEFRSKWRP